MPQQVEKKYRVASFDAILETIKQLGATPTTEVFTTHYYAPLETDGTLKMVDYKDHVEIHRLSTKDGLHSLDEIIPVNSVDEGIAWFIENGYRFLDVLDMHDKEYSYKNGGLALYVVDKMVKSVILGYPEDELPEMEIAFGLESAEQIKLPYNKYIAEQGLLRTIELTN